MDQFDLFKFNNSTQLCLEDKRAGVKQLQVQKVRVRKVQIFNFVWNLWCPKCTYKHIDVIVYWSLSLHVIFLKVQILNQSTQVRPCFDKFVDTIDSCLISHKTEILRQSSKVFRRFLWKFKPALNTHCICYDDKFIV